VSVHFPQDGGARIEKAESRQESSVAVVPGKGAVSWN
jgi:hypothetical protein